MTVFALQTIALLIVAFLAGCAIGCWARSLHGRRAAALAAVPGEPAAEKAPEPAVQKPAVQKPARKTSTPRRRAAPRSKKDDLKLLSGVGPVLEKKLNSAGVRSFAQIAQWTEKDVAAFDEKLKFKGRIEREKWVEQAKVLAEGGETEFSKRAKK